MHHLYLPLTTLVVTFIQVDNLIPISDESEVFPFERICTFPGGDSCRRFCCNIGSFGATVEEHWFLVISIHQLCFMQMCIYVTLVDNKTLNLSTYKFNCLKVIIFSCSVNLSIYYHSYSILYSRTTISYLIYNLLT